MNPGPSSMPRRGPEPRACCFQPVQASFSAALPVPAYFVSILGVHGGSPPPPPQQGEGTLVGRERQEPCQWNLGRACVGN